MKRAIKIKAYVMLLAWLTIFAHNVIPHNHIEDNMAICHSLVHNTPSDCNNAGSKENYLNQPGDITVCHISNLLFHSFNQENFIAWTTNDINLSPLRIADKILPVENQSYFSDHFGACFLFRAPPAA